MNFPRVVLAGLSGGTGKTIVTLGLCRAFKNMGKDVRPFKKGPDYIDAKWLGLAAGNACANLDPYLMDSHKLKSLLAYKGRGGDIAIIEGNRGLFDGKDIEGSCSTAELARIIETPVILTIDCTKMTRTVAAIVAGCKQFEAGFNLAGVVLNRTAGERHRQILKDSIEEYTDIPVLGMLPKIPQNPIPERHMGLVSDREYADQEKSLQNLSKIAEECIDLSKVEEIATGATHTEINTDDLWDSIELTTSIEKPVIGVVRDAALWFYYEENLEALKIAGAKIVELSLLSDEPWPKIDGLYLGGGFPETLAKELSENCSLRNHVKELAESGLPIYAECGGFMYLGNDVEFEGKKYAMSGVLPLSTKLCKRPQGLGYTEGVILKENPFYKVGATILGHEFHYSYCIVSQDVELDYSLDLKRGKGMASGKDGLLYKNIFAGYNHVHALGAPCWAGNFVNAAIKFRNSI